MVAIPSFMIRMRRDRRHLRGGVGSERARTRGIGREVLVFAKVDILGTESMVLATEKGDTTENPVNTTTNLAGSAAVMIEMSNLAKRNERKKQALTALPSRT